MRPAFQGGLVLPSNTQKIMIVKDGEAQAEVEEGEGVEGDHELRVACQLLDVAVAGSCIAGPLPPPGRSRHEGRMARESSSVSTVPARHSVHALSQCLHIHTHTRTHACTHAHMHARTHAPTHARTHA